MTVNLIPAKYFKSFYSIFIAGLQLTTYGTRDKIFILIMIKSKPINIVHISDLHFGSEHLVHSIPELQNGISRLIKSIKDKNVFLLVSGDITYQGSRTGFEKARVFLDKIIKDNNIKRSNILLCPGNHDKVQEEKDDFECFQSFSYSLKRDKVFTYIYPNTSCNFLTTEDAFFLGINSSFKLDYRFGLADINSIHRVLKETSQLFLGKVKIAFLHHHLINQFEHDLSVLRNAYDLLVLLDEYKFKYIFHGHQHTNQFLPIGETKMYIFGVRTFNFETRGYSNGLNHYMILENSITVDNYIYLKDIEFEGVKGGFQKVFSREVF